MLAVLISAVAAWAVPALAVEQVGVVALFQGKALLRIDGRNRLLRAGETSPEGVRLVEADSRRAVVEFNDGVRELGLQADISANIKRPVATNVRIPRDRTGMYRTPGAINGRPVRFLVDTGATQVAINADQARQLGIDYRVVGTEATVLTASAPQRAWQVNLDRISVGSIELRNVGAVVLDGPLPADVLLGMSFLGQVEMDDEGSLLVLTRRF